jgi:hypothetical protein
MDGMDGIPEQEGRGKLARSPVVAASEVAA